MSRLTCFTTIVVVVGFLTSHLTTASEAFYSTLTFWDGPNFTGKMWQFHRWLQPQYCYNDNVGKPTSITWKDMPQGGAFGGKAKIAFYTEHDCKGQMRSWFVEDDKFPTNLSLDGINNQIKSFMLWQTSNQPSILVHDAIP